MASDSELSALLEQSPKSIRDSADELGFKTVRSVIEEWRFAGKLDDIAELLAEQPPGAQWPHEWVVYLHEIDHVNKDTLGFGSDYIPMTTKGQFEEALATLRAPDRYYFQLFTHPTAKAAKVRPLLKSYAEKAPDRVQLWDVLYAATLKPKNKAQAERVYALCRPAIVSEVQTIDAHQTGSLAGLVCMRAALWVRDEPMLAKCINLLSPTIDMRAPHTKELLFNLRSAVLQEPHQTDTEGLEPTHGLLLSRIFRNYCLGTPWDEELEILTALLKADKWPEPMYAPEFGIRFWASTYSTFLVRFDEAILGELIRRKQGPLKELSSPAEKQLAVVCHVMGGIASVGLGEGETNSDLRDLTAGLETAWAYRGLAKRILESGKSYLLKPALEHLQTSYKLPDFTPGRNDPFSLWCAGDDILVVNRIAILKWVLDQQTPLAFNSAMRDIGFVTISAFEDDEDDPDVLFRSYVRSIAQHEFLDPKPEEASSLACHLFYNGAPTEGKALFERLIAGADQKEGLVLSLLGEMLEDFPNSAIRDTAERYQEEIVSDDGRKRFDHYMALASEEEPEGDGPKHWAIYNPQLPADQRVSIEDLSTLDLLYVGATVQALKSPTSQELLPMKLSGIRDFGPMNNSFNKISGALLRQGVLRVSPQSPQGSYTLEEDGSITWRPGDVQLALNVDIGSGTSQSGIIQGMPGAVIDQVCSSDPATLVTVWQALCAQEAIAYWNRVLAHFQLPESQHEDDPLIFELAVRTYSFSQLMNLVFNACRSAAGEQKAKRMGGERTVTMARSMVRRRFENAKAQNWDIRSGFRSNHLPESFLVRYFCSVFLPMGQATYEDQVPNIKAVVAAQEALKAGGLA